MSVTLKTSRDLLSRHQSRFKAVIDKMEQDFGDMAYDHFAESVAQFSGAQGQPQGDSRRPWLGENRPFAKYSSTGFRFRSEIAAPNPIGLLSGDLLNSISYDSQFYAGFGYTKSFTSGIDYASYLLARDGTEKMVPRLVTQHMEEWTTAQANSLIMGIAAFERSLL